MALTNLAVILLKAATLDQRQDRVQEAVALCRRALPLRPQADDPLGWAFTAANLALALVRLRTEDTAGRRSDLSEAATVGRQAADILAAVGDAANACQARINRLDALVTLADYLRDERLRPIVGLGETDEDSPAMVAQLLEDNPAAYGLAETPLEVAAIMRGPAAPAEADLLWTVMEEASELLQDPLVLRAPALRSRLARELAIAIPKLEGRTSAAVERMTLVRRLIDDQVAPNSAMDTCNELGGLCARLGLWPEAAAAFDDSLAVYENIVRSSSDRERILQTLARAPRLARWSAYAHVRSGDPATAVTILERTRLRSFSRIVPGAGGRPELLSWRSATLDDVGRAATPDCPIAYIVTANPGSAVLLVRRGEAGETQVTSYESPLSAAYFIAHMFSRVQPEQGFLLAQLMNCDMGSAIESLTKPLGSLLGPVINDLIADGVHDLVLIPTGPAALLPWAAAVFSRSGEGLPVFAGEAMTLSLSPSAAAVVLSRQRAGRTAQDDVGRLLVVANPERADAPPLPGAEEEAYGIEQAFPGRVDLLAGQVARADTVLTRLPASWIVHLACHGFSNVLEPQAARLLLSDGDVTLDQLLELPELQARLVFLSACQSGQVDLRQVSDEMLGMPVAFLQAGACVVVSTLWPISDDATALLVRRFYQQLAAEFSAGGSVDVAAALAQAQRWLRSFPAYADPFFWAGFVAYGR